MLSIASAPKLLRGVACICKAAGERLGGNCESALRHSWESLEALRRMPAFLSRAYHEILSCLGVCSDVTEAKTVADQALAHLQSRGGRTFIDTDLCRLCAQAYRAAGELERARQAAEKAVTFQAALDARAKDS